MTDGKKLFIGRLPSDIREDEMQYIFGTYGTVVDVHILPGTNSSGLKGGFVVYDSAEAANAAIKVLDNVYRFRQDARDAIRVSVAKPKGGGGGGAPAAPSAPVPHFQDDRGPPSGLDHDSASSSKPKKLGGTPGPKLYVGNLPTDITEHALQYVFSTYGVVTDIHIMTGRSKSGQSSAFVNYSNQQEASTCLAALEQGYEIKPGEGFITARFADDQAPPRGGANRSSPY
mmetsp:Transcript_6446/g.14101  ORF Transcript_6446/g.14101 Transcript_6446/m.14101 type:complete len:229 (+) Transcript_6446:91-777(+)|eukprot:CAMPEP_0178448892 /NCGR_PEP_ID=MMETSP0689_2-20121128/42240_1 /TAXON_ID=160604 /ORGANISM="Amphidinium massartii, Strain CS-259" /LENGTH=228 /DNA_ID=CAMNT_0020074135 /DNA_START=25 /DNA_END=711 /DNA_ORIENTATION=+